MYSRHGMALLSTVRHFAPPPQSADADGFLNLPPWEGVPGGWDVPDYTIGAADSGDLPLITDLPDTASGDVPLAGLPNTPPPSWRRWHNTPAPTPCPRTTFSRTRTGNL